MANGGPFQHTIEPTETVKCDPRKTTFCMIFFDQGEILKIEKALLKNVLQNIEFFDGLSKNHPVTNSFTTGMSIVSAR